VALSGIASWRFAPEQTSVLRQSPVPFPFRNLRFAILCINYPNPCFNNIFYTVGVLLGFILIQPSDLQDIHSNLLFFIEEYDISLKIPDIDLSRVELEWKRFRSNIPELWKLNNDGREFQVGEAMKERGLTAHYPVVLVPGIVSTVS
jgi:hypothetical protein